MALGELGCPSLDYVYRMSWAEFRIRLFAYKRKDLDEWYKVREVAYYSYVSGWMSKKKPPSKEQFLPLGTKKGVPDELKDLIKKRSEQAKEQYFKDLKEYNEKNG